MVGRARPKLDLEVDENVLPDPSTPYGERVRRRLAGDSVAWLTTVAADGTPQPNPVWFLWDGDSLLVYNRADANRLAHVRARPDVSLHLDSNGRGGDIVVITGRAELPEGLLPPHEVPEYLAKYGQAMTRVSGSPERFSRAYPVPMRIRPRRVRGH
jgi:PPOX class probable F420-dependent enzyme